MTLRGRFEAREVVERAVVGVVDVILLELAGVDRDRGA
jgi:hypothetical protein